MVDLSVTQFKKFIIGTLVVSGVVLLISFIVVFVMEARLDTLNKKIADLKEEIKPLQSFYNKRANLVPKEQYVELAERYDKLAGQQKNTAERLEEKEQMVINLMHGLEESKRSNLDLREKSEDLKSENENLKNEIEFEKLKLKELSNETTPN